MIVSSSEKLITSTFLCINFIQPSLSADLLKINNIKNNATSKPSWSEINTTTSNLSFNDTFRVLSDEKKILNKYSNLLIANTVENQKEIVIQSDRQSEVNDVIYADGNVIVEHRGKVFKADSLIYDKKIGKISAKGNIALIVKDQIFKSSKLEYSFSNEKGYLLDVKGSINTSNLMDDLSSNFKYSDSNEIESLIRFNKKEVLNTPGKVENWLFFTDKITIDGEKWKSDKAIFSNDLLQSKQVKIVINSLEVIPEVERLRFKSSLNYLILDEKVSIPFWIGERTINKNEGKFNLFSRWNVGYDDRDKDGYFIGRKFNPIEISEKFVLDLEPQILIQRSLKGYTKSFVEKGESTTTNKVKRNAISKDYFALKSQIKGTIKSWDLEVEKNLNSFDFDKFSDAFRLKTKLSKEINFLASKWDISFDGVYREKVWNGSLGEAEIYSGYGAKLQKENSWVVNDIEKSEILSFGLSNIRSKALNSNNLVTNFKGNLFYALDQKFPIRIEHPKNKSIDISYKYIPEPITKGLILNSRLEASYSFYENGNHQDYLGLGLGPELTLGNFKNRTFDYTYLSVFPFYRFNSGESPFKFDQNNDNFTLNIAFDQQLFGPIILKSIGTLNLTSDSNNYGEFIFSKISLNWKKRSYEYGIFYQPHNQVGGISFNLFGFR